MKFKKKKIQVVIELDGELKQVGDDIVLSFPYDLSEYKFQFQDIEFKLK